MKQVFIFLLLICVAVTVEAQEEKQNTSEGYYNLTQLSFLIGEKQDMSAAMSDFVPSITMINGYRYSEHFALGLGLGITSYQYVVYPVFADFRVNVFKGNFTPVIAIKGGYSFANNSKAFLQNRYYESTYKNSGGWMCNPEIGFKTSINSNFEFLLTIGYYYQGLESKITETNGYRMVHNVNTNVNRVAFTFGFLFK